MKKLILLFLISSITFAQKVEITNTEKLNDTILQITINVTLEKEIVIVSDYFKFDNSGIVQGNVSRQIAIENINRMNEVIKEAKANGFKGIEISNLDAYFETLGGMKGTHFYPWKDGIQIPSDFDFIMSDNTYLRVYPNNYDIYRLLQVFDNSNVNIKGGNLVGDRDKHDYNTSTSSSEWGHLLAVKASKNIVVDGVRMINATGDGLVVSARNFTYQSNYISTDNVMIKNCVFDMNGRNNVSVTDGSNVTIDNNTFSNAGVINDEFPKASKGGPWMDVDVEGTRSRDSNGNLLYWEYPNNVKITNNTSVGSRSSSFWVAIGYDVLIENNKSDATIGYGFGNGIKIRNNEVISTEFKTGSGISGGKPNTDSVYDNEISGNKVNNFSIGITVYNDSTSIFNNHIENFVNGINMYQFSNSTVKNNTFISTLNKSVGIRGHSTFIDNVLIRGNIVSTVSEGLLMSYVNKGTNNTFKVDNNTFTTINARSALLGYTTGLDLTDTNIFSGDIRIIK